MSKIVFIKENSPEVRKKLEDAGYSICACAEFEDSIWLDLHPDGNFPIGVHGVGYTDTTDCKVIQAMTPIKRIQYWLKDKGYFTENREFFDTVDDFLEHYNK